MKVCVIGGGPAGLTAAYELLKKGCTVTVYEEEKEPGGLSGAFTVGKRRLEKFYHHIFTTDTQVIDLAEELGLLQSLRWLKPRNGLYLNGKLHPFTSPGDLLGFRELSFFQRVSMGSLVYRAKFIRNWMKLEDISAREWITKHAGAQVYDKVWGPLLSSKFDFDAGNISAVWIWNKFKLRGSTRRGNLGGELLGYMDGSFAALYSELAARIESLGGCIKCSAKVRRIESKTDGTLNTVTDGGVENYDRVVVTTAPGILKEMGLPFPGEYVDNLEKLKYKANICMVMELSKPLSQYYWITVAEKDFPFVLVVEHTNLTGTEGYNSHVVYLSRYMDESCGLYSESDSYIKGLFFKYLEKMFPNWDESSVINTHIHRARFAQPVVCKNYSRIVPGFATPVDNLYLACMAQIYPQDRGQNYAIKMGKEIARAVIGSRPPVPGIYVNSPEAVRKTEN